VKKFLFRIIAVLVSFTFSISSLAAPALAADQRSIDVVEITWSGAKRPDSSIGQVVESINGRVAPKWKSFTTSIGDQVDNAINFSYGKSLEAPIRLTAAMSCDGYNLTYWINSIRSETYRQLGISDWQSRYLIILAPDTGCIWSGRSLVGSATSKGGAMILHNTASAFVIMHELGHTLGLGHSNLLRCDSDLRDGAWSRSCKAVEYGGSIDVMGNVDTDSPLSTYHRWRIGLLNESEVKQSWVNEVVELTASDVKGGTRAIFIRDGNSSYWLEYRRPQAELAYKPGLVVFRTDPPSPTFIDSPNPDDRIGPEPSLGLSADLWMLNLDSYFHSSTGQATGSMTLPISKTFSLYSGNVTLETLPSTDEKKLRVKIARKVDSTPPPRPEFSEKQTWLSPEASILKQGYNDLESAIDFFELRVDGKVLPTRINSKSSFVPTYLDPFLSRRTIQVKNLPEGTYSLEVRSQDVWGNQSPWSMTESVLIDRSYPKVDVGINTITFQNRKVRAALQGFSDEGSGLCRTALFNQDGVVTSSDSAKSAPTFDFPLEQEFSSSFETFDCVGNGIGGDLSFTGSYKSASENRRTGKWSPIKSDDLAGLKCLGKCSISATLRDNAAFLFGEGSAEIVSAGKVIGRVSDSKNSTLRVGLNLSVGEKNRVVRVTGSNFAFYGLVQSKLEIAQKREISRTAFATDSSLSDGVQLRMAEYGFRQGDFSNSWQISPMDRGTTLLDPTLDLCSATYISESGRQYRRQVVASKSGSPYLFLSSEVVKYKDKSAADAALNELVNNYSVCVKNKGGIEREGTFVDYTFTPMPKSDLELVPESSRVLVRAQIGKGVSARQLLAFYQFKGEMFTGLYVVKAGEVGIDDAEVKRWFEAAFLLATRLDTKFQLL